MFTKSAFFRCLFSVALLSCLLFRAQAQTDDGMILKKNALKITPTAFFVSTFALSYERYISPGMSLQFAGGIAARERGAYKNDIFTDNTSSYNGNSGTGGDNLQDKVSGGFGELALRFYFLKGKSMISGLYAGPYGRYNSYKYYVNYGNDPEKSYNYPTIPENKVANYTATSYEGGVLFGWQWVIKNAFLFDMYVGGGIRSSSTTNKPADYGTSDHSFKYLESQNTTGVIAKIGLKLGFVF